MVVLCVLPLPKCFLTAVCFLKHFPNVLYIVLTVTISAFSSAPKSEESARIPFAAGTTCSCKKQKDFSQKALRVHKFLFVASYQYLKTKEALLVLIWQTCSSVFLFAVSFLSQSSSLDNSCETFRYKKHFPHSWCYSSE